MTTDLSYIPQAELTRLRELKASPAVRASILADACRLNTLYMVKRAGSGHLGTSFSSMDALVWLHFEEMGHEKDVFFSSKGHDAPAHYAALIASGDLPFDRIHSLRQLGGLPGHPDVGTPGVYTNTGSLGMGISKAKGAVRARRLVGRGGRVFVLMGDGELQEGQVWESLQSAANETMGEIIALIDRNQIQSDTWTRDVLDYDEVARKFEAFGWETLAIDGHDMEAIGKALRGRGSPGERPTLVILQTIKGKGVSFMEGIPSGQTWYRYHSGAPSDEEYARALEELRARLGTRLKALGEASPQLETVAQPPHRNPRRPQNLVAAYTRALVAAAEKDPRVVALDADLILDTGLVPFKDRFPERFFECGIAEQDMVSQAGAMALEGLLPFAHSFTCFLSARPNEQIYNNATERTKIVYVGSLAGLLPAGTGHSHQCVRDVSALGAVPGLVILEPCTEAEAEMAVAWAAFENTASTFLRLVSVRWDVPFALPDDYRLREGQGVPLTHGDDALIMTCGPVLLSEAYRAVERLRAEHGVHATLMNMPWLNRVDEQWLRKAVAGHELVVTVDNHYLKGGQGEMLAARILELSLDSPPRVRRLGVPDIPVCGKNEEVLAHYGLDADGLQETLLELVGSGGVARRV